MSTIAAVRPAAGRPLPRGRTATGLFLRELLRRWPSTLFMVAMPGGYFLTVYLLGGDGTVPVALHVDGDADTVQVLDRDAKSVYNAVLGAGVSSAFAALVTIRGSASAMRRLRLMGYRAWELLAARLVVLLVITVLAAGLFALLLLPLIQVRHPLSLFAAMTEIGVLGIALGSLFGTLPMREFEATMAIVALCGLQLAIGRSEDGADAERYLLFTPGVDAVKVSAFSDPAPIAAALGQGLGYAAVLLVLACLVWSRRTRIHSTHPGRHRS
ncbi:hypothetical protein ACFPH6_04390 [Streptomyces xiangluensis]|uniref:ABC-2 type transport system permease protein n=1 Tax=Streptomyces xiangluensis TaxID=2665720 RepID=A0ABV8YHQ6_9ACTN